jgi:hypothetical protein
MDIYNITVTQIRELAALHGVKPGQAWVDLVYPALSAASRTEPGVMPKTSHNL